jgi:hypothetical protein
MTMVVKTPRPVVSPADEIARRRRGRSWALLVVLAGLAVLFYAITIVKMAHP